MFGFLKKKRRNSGTISWLEFSLIDNLRHLEDMLIAIETPGIREYSLTHHLSGFQWKITEDTAKIFNIKISYKLYGTVVDFYGKFFDDDILPTFHSGKILINEFELELGFKIDRESGEIEKFIVSSCPPRVPEKFSVPGSWIKTPEKPGLASKTEKIS